MANYEIGEKIGQGGMGVVYKAYHAGLDLDVAVKFIHQHLAEDEDAVQRFLQEARLAARIKHANVVQIYDTGRDPEGRPYIVMEYLEGESLRARLMRGPITSSETVEIVRSVLSALDKAHGMGVVHRDIKPANIFLCSDGMVKLVDFGVAKALSGVSLTGTGTTLGTPEYMSPEQVEACALDCRSDIYSVGVVMHEMLTGSPPFQAESPIVVLRMHLDKAPPALPSAVPSGIRSVVAKAMSKRPAGRYTSACEMVSALGGGGFSSGRRESREPRFPTADSDKLSSRETDTAIDCRRWATCSIDTSVLEGHAAWVLGVAFTPDGSLVISASSDKTGRIWDVKTGRELKRLLGHTNLATSVAIAPDGSLAVSGGYDDTIRVWDVASGREMRRFEGPSWVYCVAFNPDGSLLASGGSDGTAQILTTTRGIETRRIKAHASQVNGVAFSPDGNLLASCGGDVTVRLWEVSSGGAVRQLTGHSAWVHSVAFSNDGRLLASGSTDKTIGLWSVPSGDGSRRLLGHTGPVNAVSFSPDGRVLASGSSDGTVRLWDTVTGRHIRRLDGHTEPVCSVAFTRGGDILASGSWDKTVRLWRMKDECA